MKRQWNSILAMIVAATVLLFMTTNAEPAPNAVKVGIILPITGPKAKFVEIEKQSFDMALEEINKGGGVKGRKLEFIFEDDTGRPNVARSAAVKLITEDKVVMLTGGYGSSETYEVAGVAQKNRSPFLIHTASADRITEQGWDYIFRLNPPVSEFAGGLEDFLATVVKPKTTVILHENSPYGTEGAKSFQKTCEKVGIEVLVVEGYKAGVIDFKPLLGRIEQLNADIVYMMSHPPDASLLVRQFQELKFTPKLFIGCAAGFTLPEFAQTAGKAAEKVVSATLWHQVLPLPGAMDYFNKFKAKYNKDTEYHGAAAYAAAYVVKDVFQRARSFAPGDIKQALKETNLMTVLGPVKFTSYDKKINQNKLTTYVLQWQDGKLKLIWPRNLANAEIVYPVKRLKEWGYQ